MGEGNSFFFVEFEAPGPVTVSNTVFSRVASCNDVKTAVFL